MTQTLEQLSAAATQGEYDKRVQLWFFRELTSDQRLALFKLCGLPVDEIGHNHSHQRLCLKRILRRTGQLVAVADDAMVERVAKAIYDALVQDKESDAWIGSSDQLDAVTIDGDVNLLLCAKAALAAKGTGDE